MWLQRVALAKGKSFNAEETEEHQRRGRVGAREGAVLQALQNDLEFY